MTASAFALAFESERRRRERADFTENTLILCDLGSDNGGLVLDLHEEGFLVQAIEALPSDITVPFRLHVPGSNLAASGTARIAWTSGKRAGLSVTMGDPTALAQLAELSECFGPQVLPSMEQEDSSEIHVTTNQILSHGEAQPPPQIDLSKALEAIVSASGADGGALAFDHEGVMVCAASVGNAPAAGTVVSAHAGLAGECVRTARLVYCNDTESDWRVDPNVTRRMNIRSALVAPLSSASNRAGLVQLFSSQPAALSPQQVLPILERELAGIEARDKVTASTAEPKNESALDVTVLEATKDVQARQVSSLDSSTEQTSRISLQAFAAGLWVKAVFVKVLKEQRRAAIVVAAALAFLVSTGFYLKSSHSTLAAANSNADTAAAIPATPPRALQVTDTAPAITGFHTAAITKHVASTATKPAPAAMEVIAVHPSQPAAQPAVVEAPAPLPSFSTPEIAANSTPLASILTSTAPASLAAPVSSGLVEGKLLFGAAPIYPIAARGRLGEVHLQLRVAKDGSVKQIEVLNSDDIVLDAAARQAVSQWRYAPSTIDGRPVEINHQITVQFK